TWHRIGCGSARTLSAAPHLPRSTWPFLSAVRLFLKPEHPDIRTVTARLFQRLPTSLAVLIRLLQRLGSQASRRFKTHLLCFASPKSRDDPYENPPGNNRRPGGNCSPLLHPRFLISPAKRRRP